MLLYAIYFDKIWIVVQYPNFVKFYAFFLDKRPLSEKNPERGTQIVDKNRKIVL